MVEVVDILVEGIADQKFLADVIISWYGYKIEGEVRDKKDTILVNETNFKKAKIKSFEGKDVLETERKKNLLCENLEINISINKPSLLIFDADFDFLGNFKKWNDFKNEFYKDKNTNIFDIFFWPNNQDLGNKVQSDLEYLLFDILCEDKLMYWSCFDDFDKCVELKFENSYNLCFHDNKTRIFSFLSTFGRESKEVKRNYFDAEIFNLNPTEKPILKPLKTTLDKYLN